MKEMYLEVTYRGGRPLAAYFYLPRRSGQRSHRTERVEAGMLVDYSRGGKPIGIEITAPSKISLAALNRVLRELGFGRVKRDDIAPLLAA